MAGARLIFLDNPSVPADAQPVNFPAIDKVRGEGGAARMIEGRQALGGEYGFMDEVLPWSDEVGAAASAAVDFARAGLSGRFVDPRDLYDEHAAILRAEQEAYRDAHPTAATAANVLGGMAALPAATALKGGQGLWETAKASGKASAMLGALWGSGEGEDITGRMEGGGWGAAIGGALGFGVPVLVNAGQRVLGAVQRLYGLKGAGAERRANEMMAEALARDGIKPGDLAGLAKSGKPLSVADLGANTRQLVGAAKRQGSEGRQILEDFFEQRALGQYGRLSEDLRKGIGVRGEQFADTAGDIVKRRGAAAAQGYAAAYAQPAPTLSEAAEKILATPDGRLALSNAKRMMENAQKPMKDAAGNYTVEALDQIQRAMRDRASRASGNRAAELSANLSNLRDRFMKEFPADLRQVMANYRSETELLDAMKAGREFFKGDAETMLGNLKTLTPQEQDMFRLGAVREIRGRIGSKIDSGDISGMFQNPQIRERIAAIFPSKRLFQEFVESTATERSMMMTRNAILKGSQTAERIVDDAGFSGGALGEFATDVVSGGANGVSVGRAVLNAAMRGKDRFISGVNEQVADQIAKTAVNPDLAAVGAQLGGPGVPAVRYPAPVTALAPARGMAAAAAAASGPSGSGSTSGVRLVFLPGPVSLSQEPRPDLPVDPEDIESPIPTQLLQVGREVMRRTEKGTW